MTAPMVSILNAHMFGSPGAPGEHIDWSEPDALPADEWPANLGMAVDEYASANPHMIVFLAGETLELVCTIGTCPEIAEPAHSPCCSSHGRALCCEHYGRTHFCVGACSPDSHADAAMAAACARELSRSGGRR